MSATGNNFSDDDPALRYVDPNNRIELDRLNVGMRPNSLVACFAPTVSLAN